MPVPPPLTNPVLRHPLRFLWSTVGAFRANQGLLLSGAVAYYTLLSIIPLFALLLIALSHLVDPARVLAIATDYLNLLLPAQAAAITDEIATFLDHREVIGGVGFIVMLFFSSLAFSVLENAMSVIFYHRVRHERRRSFLASAALPYAYIGLVGLGLLLVTTISGALQAVEGEQLRLFGWALHLDGVIALALHGLGVLGLIVLLTSFYLGMPIGRIAPRHALIGGVTATVLWEIVRRVLVWYFTTLSMVNVIYGSLAAVIVALLSLEIGGMIVLFGAQVIAEYDRVTRGGGMGEPPIGLRT